MSSSHDITLTPQEQALIMRLKSFRVPEMAHILEEQLKDPNADLNTFMERMTAMVDAEWQARADKRFNRLMKEAHLRYPAADLDETIYRPERQLDTQTIERLSTCHTVAGKENLGNPIERILFCFLPVVIREYVCILIQIVFSSALLEF